MLVAGKKLVLGDGDVREIGDPVPEAASWRHLRPWMRSGHIKDVPESDEGLPDISRMNVRQVMELVTERPELREDLRRIEENGRRRSGLLRDLDRVGV